LPYAFQEILLNPEIVGITGGKINPYFLPQISMELASNLRLKAI
jgi:hypothetical protein